MRMLEQHPNVAKLYSVYEDAVSYHLVMELCTGGELFDKVGPCSGPAAPSTCTIIAGVCMAALLPCQQHGKQLLTCAPAAAMPAHTLCCTQLPAIHV